MGLFTDIALYCDICGKEGCDANSIRETRRIAKQDGWKRKKVMGEMLDICPACVKGKKCESQL